jgi:hypothetical protein
MLVGNLEALRRVVKRLQIAFTSPRSKTGQSVTHGSMSVMAMLRQLTCGLDFQAEKRDLSPDKPT